MSKEWECPVCYETLGTPGILPMVSVSCGHVGHMVCCACVLRMPEQRTEDDDFYQICPQCRAHTTGYVAGVALIDMDNDPQSTELLARFKALQDARIRAADEEASADKLPVRRRLFNDDVPARVAPVKDVVVVTGDRVEVCVDLRGFGVPPSALADPADVASRMSMIGKLVFANTKARFAALPGFEYPIQKLFFLHEDDYHNVMLPNMSILPHAFVPGKYIVSAPKVQLQELIACYKDSDMGRHPDFMVVDQNDNPFG